MTIKVYILLLYHCTLCVNCWPLCQWIYYCYVQILLNLKMSWSSIDCVVGVFCFILTTTCTEVIDLWRRADETRSTCHKLAATEGLKPWVCQLSRFMPRRLRKLYGHMVLICNVFLSKLGMTLVLYIEIITCVPCLTRYHFHSQCFSSFSQN